MTIRHWSAYGWEGLSSEMPSWGYYVLLWGSQAWQGQWGHFIQGKPTTIRYGN